MSSQLASTVDWAGLLGDAVHDQSTTRCSMNFEACAWAMLLMPLQLRY